jgi:hypothetical protein
MIFIIILGIVCIIIITLPHVNYDEGPVEIDQNVKPILHQPEDIIRRNQNKKSDEDNKPEIKPTVIDKIE